MAGIMPPSNASVHGAGCRGRNGQRGSRGSLLQFQNISATVCSRFLSGRFFSSRCNGPSVKLEEFKLNEQTELLREMCHLLRVIAEHQLALRDELLRASLLESVGKGKATAKAAHLMDGTRNQTAICKESGIDAGALSRLTKDLRARGLIAPEEKNPKLIITIPPTFFDSAKK